MPDLTNFKKSVKWYDANLDSLLAEHRGQYVGVNIDKFCGAWEDEDTGLQAMMKAGYVLGDFIVQHCVPREEEATIICHTDNPFRNPVSLF